MTKREMLELDKLLTKLQRHIDRKYVISQAWAVIVKAREIVHVEIEATKKTS